MKVKMILPALAEARSPEWRSIKYSLFPPLGLATLASYLSDDDEVTLQDEHVEELDLDDEPDLVVLQVYIPSAYRAYEIADRYRARGCRVVMGGIHVTSRPEEAAPHADTIFLGPGEDIWPAFLSDLRAGKPRRVYVSRHRGVRGTPRPRRELFRRGAYLVPNSLVVSRGCPHRCDFCYKESFYEGGASFYTRDVDEALEEVESLPGRHLYFLDDHLFGNLPFVSSLLDGLAGMGRRWQAAGTVQSILLPGLMEKAAEAGLRSLFVGFETLNPRNLEDQHKSQNLHRDYTAAVERLHGLGIMVNASFVFGMDDDDPLVFDRTVEWAVQRGIETATFHILTPYPGTRLHDRLSAEGRITSENWDRYDTRHAVYRPARMTAKELEEGYWHAYREFYRWGSIFRGARSKVGWAERLRHIAYAGGWKKLDSAWDLVVRSHQVSRFVPILEAVLSGSAVAPESKGQEAGAPVNDPASMILPGRGAA